MQDGLHIQKTLPFRLSELHDRHAGPARNDFRDFPGGHLAGDAGVLFLPLLLVNGQLFALFLFLVPQPGGSFEVLLVDRRFLFLVQPFDLFLQLFQVRRSSKGF